MRGYETLSRRGEIGRLRHLARMALDRFGVGAARLAVLRHEHNSTFRVDTAGGRYVLRLNRTGVHDVGTVGSEMAWLTALSAQTDLGVPEPVAARDGSMVLSVSDPGVPEPRLCVLLHWQQGRFVDERLTPDHLRAVGALLARLQQHALRWRPPEGFVRPRVDTLTAAARRASISGPFESDVRMAYPTRADGDGGRVLIERLFSATDAALVERGLRLVRRTSRELARQTEAMSLIHADLHYENFMFRAGEALAIDFDDCGWGFHLYDLAVPLSELEGRLRYDTLRAALLEGYALHRALPKGYEAHLRALAILRRMQLLMWVVESRALAAFRDDWHSWGRKELDGLARALNATDA